MDAGGKMKNNRGQQQSKPYSRPAGLLGRVSESVKDMLSPSWLVDLVSSVKKKTPPPESQPMQHAREQCSSYEAYQSSRPMPDLSNTYMPPPQPSVGAQMPSYSSHVQHSTPAQQHQQHDVHFQNTSMPLAGLNKLDLHSNLLSNGSEEHTELSDFASNSNQYGQSLHQQSTSAPNKFYNTDTQSKIQQLRQELGGSVTPSKEIEERAKLQTQVNENKLQTAEPSFLWANETKKEVKKNAPQPPAKRHKPNFSTAVFGSTSFGMNHSVDPNSTMSNSFHSSSFYPGKTMFGGASGNRSRQRQANPYQMTPTRKQVSVKSAASARSGVTSSAAKRILDCLERMSTPLSDAKKIPSYNSSLVDSPLSFTPGVYRRRSIRQPMNKNAPPVGNRSTPTQASVGKNLQKPMSNTLERTALKQTTQNEPQFADKGSSYDIISQRDSSGKTGGKMKRERSTFHSKRQDEEDVEVEAPALSTGFTLPVSGNLPKFDFGAVSKTTTDNNKRPEFITSSPIIGDAHEKKIDASLPFTFSSPIAETNRAITVQADISEKAFKFSSPISVDKKQAPADTAMAAASAIVSSAPSLAFTFTPTAKLKVKPKASNEESAEKSSSGGLKPAAELKTGGVMDFLGKSSGLSPAKQLATGSVLDVLASKKPTEVKSSLGEKKDDTKSKDSSLPPLSAVFAKPAAGWSCPTCMIQNQDSVDQCPCCSEPKPRAKPAEKPSSSTNSSTNKQSNDLPSLTSVFKSTGGWSCPTCMVKNEDSMDKCPCCQEPKPGSKPKPSLSDMFKQKGWSCPTCMVQNQDSHDKCPCCLEPKPGSKNSDSTSSKTPDSSTSSNKASTLPSLSEMFKKPAGNWDCDTCMVSNKPEATKCIACETPKPGLKPQSSFTSPGGFSGFKFGAPASSTTTTSSVSSGFGFASTKADSTTTTTSGFAFGFGKKTDESSSNQSLNNEVNHSGGFKFTPSASSDKPALGGFKFGTTTSESNKNDSDKKVSESEQNKPVSTFQGFGNTSESKDNAAKPTTGGFVFGTPKPDTSSEKPTSTSAGGFQFSAPKSDTSKDNEAKPAGGFVFGNSTSEAKPKESVVSSTGIFGSSAKTGSNVTDTAKSNSVPLFGNVNSTVKTSTTSTSAASSSGFVFGSNAASKTATTSSSGGFSFGKPSSSDNTIASTASTSSFGGFGSGNSEKTPVSSTGTGIFGMASAGKPAATSSSTPSSSSAMFGVFGGAAASATATTKAEESKPAPASGLFVFGQPAKTEQSAANVKPLGASGGFNFGSNTNATVTQASNLFAFGAANKPSADSAALGASPSLKRTRDTGDDKTQNAKKGGFGSSESTNIFGSGNGTATSAFGGSQTFGSGTDTATPVFGATHAPKIEAPAFGSTASSSVFGTASGGSSVFGSSATPQSSGGFNFNTGSQAKTSATGSNSLFQFGANQNQSGNNSVASNPFTSAQSTGEPASSSTPVFGAQPTAPQPASQPNAGFNFNVGAPSFNFSAGNASTSGGFNFNAQPTANTNMFAAKPSTAPAGRRPIKKALRRTTKK